MHGHADLQCCSIERNIHTSSHAYTHLTPRMHACMYAHVRAVTPFLSSPKSSRYKDAVCRVSAEQVIARARVIAKPVL